MSQAPELSVIVPVFNEVENISPLWRELDAVLGRLGRSAEVVFVDDGSTDGSADAIRALMAGDPRVRLLCFDANAGLTAAFHAGYGAARGRIVATVLRTAGYRVIEVPVQRRPRRFGRSKYGIRNRALRAFVDLLAVQWMMRRAVRYRVREVARQETATQRRSSGGEA